MKKGSILLELIIATTISALVGMIILNTFSQTNLALQVATDISRINRSTLVVGSLLRGEISGIEYLSQRVEKKKKKKKKEEDKKSGGEKKKDEKKGVPSETSSQKKKEPEKKEYKRIPLKNIFYSENRDGNVHRLTFITKNPLPAFTNIKSRLARVEYTLELDRVVRRKTGKRAFKLFRRESPILAYEKFEKAKGALKYEVCRNIKNFTTEYITARRKKKKEEKKEGEEEEEKEETDEKEEKKKDEGDKQDYIVEYKNFTEWKGRQIIGKDKKGKNIKRSIPSFFTFKIAFWDDQFKNTKRFEFKIKRGI